MSVTHCLTARAFAAYLQCKTKGQLLSRSIPGDTADFAELLLDRFKEVAAPVIQETTGRALLRYDELPAHLAAHGEPPGLIDCDTTYIDITRIVSEESHESRQPVSADLYVPVLFVPNDPILSWHKALLGFAAIAVRDVGGATTGYICHGPDKNIKRLRISDAITATVDTLIELQRTLVDDNDVPLILNKHCTICKYKTRCRQVAIDTDNLSLLGTLGEKERRQLAEKGIRTISQLSYGYRPRRKRHVHATFRPTSVMINKNDNKLKALAVKKQQIHVIDAKSPTEQGAPVYLDVEGTLSHDRYYLIGMRYKADNHWLECALWANRREDEQTIWVQCLQRLASIERPQIVHYGHYERQFLQRMQERYPETMPHPQYVDELLARSVNLVSLIYGSIYFPTYGNGLKEVAGYLGFRWTDPEGSGGLAPLWRLYWELTFDEQVKSKLVRYNIEDCRAAELVGTAIDGMRQRASAESGRTLDIVDVSSLEVPYQRTFGKFVSAVSGFKEINDAAYWNYQRERVFVRTDDRLRRLADAAKKPRAKRTWRPDKVVWVEGAIPPSCIRCSSRTIWKAGCQSQTVRDIVFSKIGVRRRITRYAIQRYRCGVCRQEMGVPRQKTSYGRNLRAYVVYLLIEMRLSRKNIADHLQSMFGLIVNPTMIHDIKTFVAEEYEPLYRTILRSITSCSLVHADETKGVEYGGGHYVWVFANLSAVAYVYSATREADVLEEVLQGFSGVLISDFYTGYDSIECPQQKCLIHLMRDINEAVLKNPFNPELWHIASDFGALLRSIVASVDRWGLRARRLQKHRREADKFLREVESLECSSEAAIALRKRLLKNRSKLFTFLDYDVVPWNNNNAEHAVRAFTRIRNTMATSTPRGTKEYATLLSIQQTLKYRNIDFLEFLRSGRMEIDGM